MKNWKTRLVALTLVAVAVLAAGALLGNDTAYARPSPCCSSCDVGYDNCIAGCNGDPTCEANCDNYWFTSCYRWCNPGC